MVMLRANDAGFKVAEKVLKNKGIKVRKPQSERKKQLQTPYLQH